MVPVAREVVERRRETADTVTLALAPDGTAPRPGQFHMLSVFGVGEVPISVSGLDRPDGAVEHTVRAVGSVTDVLVDAAVGGVVGGRGPFGVGWDLAAAEGGDVVVVAGGIGLAPLRPLVQAVLARRERFGAVVVLVGARTPDDLCFVGDLDGWAARPDVHVALTVDRPLGPGSDPWPGAVGVVTQLVDVAPFDPARATAFVCGPEVMMRFAARALVDRGMAAGAVQVTLERSMSCGIGQCGHCQLGPLLVCRDGPVVGAEAFLQLATVPER